MSISAVKRYINPSSGLIRVLVLSGDAENLPQRHRTWQSFKSEFDSKNTYEYTFYGYKIVVDLRYAFKHFHQNTYNEQRNHLNGTLYDILHQPLLVIKKYDAKLKKNTLQFYKVYKNKDALHHMMMFQVIEESQNVYRYKTLFDVSSSLHKVSDMIKAVDLNTVYFKYDKQ